jgi:hypothetical protein
MTRVDSLQPRIARIHETPTRVRLRIDSPVDHARRETLIAALATSPVVVSFRIAWSCRSVTVAHTADAAGVCRLVQQALERDASLRQRQRLPAAVPRGTRRAAARRLVWCSLIGLALAILPTPGRPALAALRLAVSIVVALVQHRAKTLLLAPVEIGHGPALLARA